MALINKPWSDTPPPPLPSYPPAADTDGPETTRWLLVSFAGRAGVQIRRRCVVGSGPSCDLCLVEWAISPHHALLTVEEGELYITPLSDAATLVDGRALEARLRLSADSVLTFGDIDFAVHAQVPETHPAHPPLGETTDDEIEPLPEYVAPREKRDAAVAPDAPLPVAARRRSVAPISLGIAVPLALFALWFYRADQWPAQLDLVTDRVATLTPPSASMPSPAPPTTAPAPADEHDAPPPPESPTQPATAPEFATSPAAPMTETSQIEPASEVTVSPLEALETGAQPRVSDVPPDVAVATTPPAEPDVVVESMPAPMVADSSPATMPMEAGAASATTDDAPVTTVVDAAPAMPQVEVDALRADRADAGPPLIFPAPPPLVDVVQLQAADARVRPPWSDGTPVETSAVESTSEGVADDAPATAMVDAVLVPAMPEAETESLRADVGPPLIFPPPPPLIEVTQLEAVDGRVKPPWSDRPPVVVSADARLLVFPASLPLVDLQALSTVDARVRPPWSDIPPTVAGVAHADGSVRAVVATLLFEAGRLYSQGDLVTPAHQNAAALYGRVLALAPKTKVARTRLSNIVGWIALDASDMLLERRTDAARLVLAQLASAVPKVRRASVDAAPMRRWRVMELLIDADALIQKRRISGPAKPNAVALLREALRIEPHNAAAEQMLSKAFSLVADAPRR